MNTYSNTIKPVFPTATSYGGSFEGTNHQGNRKNASTSDSFLSKTNSNPLDSISYTETTTSVVIDTKPQSRTSFPNSATLYHSNALVANRGYNNYLKPLDVDQVQNNLVEKQQAYIKPFGMNAYAQTEARNAFASHEADVTLEKNTREKMIDTLYQVVPEAIRKLTPENIMSQVKIFKTIYENSKQSLLDMVETPAGKMTLNGLKQFMNALITRSEQLFSARREAYLIQRQPILV